MKKEPAKIVLPSAVYQKSFLEALSEFKAVAKRKEIEDGIIARYEKSADFADFVRILRGQARGKYLPPGFVPASTYWLVKGKKFLGWLNLRHRLTAALREIGGHIGYAIRPSERLKGYGTLLLRFALRKARRLGIKDARLTCDEDNIGSRKIIEANGGVFDSTLVTDQGLTKRRYWIPLATRGGS